MVHLRVAQTQRGAQGGDKGVAALQLVREIPFDQRGALLRLGQRGNGGVYLRQFARSQQRQPPLAHGHAGGHFGLGDGGDFGGGEINHHPPTKPRLPRSLSRRGGRLDALGVGVVSGLRRHFDQHIWADLHRTGSKAGSGGARHIIVRVAERLGLGVVVGHDVLV